MLKVCPRCDRDKTIAEFGQDSSRSDGLQCWCKDCRKESNKLYYDANPEKFYIWGRQRHRELREALIKGYGGSCACCGEVAFEFLCIDHIHGGGNADRAQHKSDIAFYKWLLQNGCPKDNYRLLCHNCNMAIGFYGYCPHEGV